MLQPGSTHAGDDPTTRRLRELSAQGAAVKAEGRVTTNQLRARWRREAIESGHNPDEWVKVVLGQLAAAPRTGERYLDWDLEARPESRSKWPGPATPSTSCRALSRLLLADGDGRSLMVLSSHESGCGGAPNQYQDPVEATQRTST